MSTIADARYVRLTTFTGDGRPKRTPVWIVGLEDGTLAFTTSSESLKAKRIHHTPKVQLQASDFRGKPTSAEVVEGTAEIAVGVEFERVAEAIRRKYGWQAPAAGVVNRVLELFGRSGRVNDCAVVITPGGSGG